MLVLMQSPDGGPMNVPEAKVAQYLADGWKVIPSKSPEPAPITPAPLPPALAAELATSPAPLDRKKGKGKS